MGRHVAARGNLQLRAKIHRAFRFLRTRHCRQGLLFPAGICFEFLETEFESWAELGLGIWNEFASGEFYEGMSEHQASFLDQLGYDLKDGLDL